MASRRPDAAAPALSRRDACVEPPQPILKWAGGKRSLLPDLCARLPARFERYYEPFFGGGALFFHLLPDVARLSDVNSELIDLYRVTRDSVEELIEDLRTHRYERGYYYAMRATDPRTLGPVQRASRTIYLNRTCFNGLYRVNRRGQFNVPMGRYQDPVICQADRLRAASQALAGVDLRDADFTWVLDEARAGDFVYFDPPYQPVSRTANFTSYARGDFGEKDQAHLAEVFSALASRGVHCMLSNSDTPLVRDLYGEFRCERVFAPRAISRRGDGRQSVAEVIVLSYDP
ncbi:MAG: DNA adenine methylase [Deltaproteobacteria bacterium]|nr:DNA adenine methylase [Deltaproteobacteria bacterium]MCB9788039.1 DNA adenine methylase [Deltaproteobacteria bacterium]